MNRRVGRNYAVVCALLAVALGCSAVPGAAQQVKVLAPHDPVPPKATRSSPLPASTAGSVVGGPWMVDTSFTATVYIKNLLETSAVTVTPVLYLSNGTQYILPPMKLDPAGISTIDVGTALAHLGITSSTTLYGYVEVRYNWPWVPICVTLRDLDVAHSLIFYYGSRPTNPNPIPNQPPPVPGTKTNVFEGVWWKQEAGVGGFITLANTGAQPVNAQVDLRNSLKFA